MFNYKFSLYISLQGIYPYKIRLNCAFTDFGVSSSHASGVYPEDTSMRKNTYL